MNKIVGLLRKCSCGMFGVGRGTEDDPAEELVKRALDHPHLCCGVVATLRFTIDLVNWNRRSHDLYNRRCPQAVWTA